MSDSEDDDDPLQQLPKEYVSERCDDGWPPAKRFAESSMVAIPPVPRPKSVTVIQDAVDERLLDRIIAFAEKSGWEPWGQYVSFTDVLSPGDNSDDSAKGLARECVKALWFDAIQSRDPALFPKENFQDVHGFEVWCLSGNEGNNCPYHIDFAEFQRYQYNVVFLPIYSATLHVCQCTVEGGCFMANTEGLDHYRKYGYKGAHVGGASAIEKDFGTSSWVTVPYKFNQAIIIDGSLPHLSTKVSAIEPAGKKRVLLATNVYDKFVGPRVQDFPIHSERWKRVLKFNNILSNVMKASDGQADAVKGAVGPYGEKLRKERHEGIVKEPEGLQA